MRFLMVWGNVWRIVGTGYVWRIMVGIFCGKSRLMEVSPMFINHGLGGLVPVTVTVTVTVRGQVMLGLRPACPPL